MAGKIKLDIISDVVCPWCIIGYNHLEAAINELGLQDRVEIEWLPFELNPDMPAEGEHLRAHVQRKYGASAEDSQRTRFDIAERGAVHGFKFDYFDEMKMVNTLDAHVLLEFAKKYEKQTELKLRLFSAFFTEHKDVSDRSVLIEEVKTVGLDGDKALAWLNDGSHHKAIREQETYWQQAGVSGVPTVILNQESAVTGAYPVEGYKEILKEFMG
ncbi:UNVERIFIED_CONTAM: hypothetical protein GTU68_064588 [Idotea baltica]|nr:hypothetical protein [Idotea baltica]